MITINLLPEELKKAESSLSKISVGLKFEKESIRNIIIASIATLFIIHISLFIIGSRSLASFKNLSDKYNRILPEKKKSDALKTEVDMMARKAKAVEGLMATRFSWTKKLNDLSDSITPGIWLTELSYEESYREIAVPVKTFSISAGSKKEITRTETKKMNLRYLTISGYASSMGEQGTALIARFIKSMKDNKSFFSDFRDIRLDSINSEKMQDQEVMSFKITCLLNIKMATANENSH